MQIDPTKSAVQNLLALIDASNPDAPDMPDEVAVSGLTSGSYPNGGDTQVTLTGTGHQADNHNFGGTVNVTYKRLTLAAEAASPAGPVILSSSATAAAALTAVENYFGFVAGEVTAPDFTPVPTGPQTMTLHASGSLLYADGTVDVDVNYVSKTVALFHFDGADGSTTYTDATGLNAPTGTSMSLSTAQSKFGGSSLAVGVGAAANLSFPDTSELRITTGDATIEMWINCNNPAGQFALFGKAATTGGPYNHIAGYAGSWYFYDNANSQTILAPITIAANVWSHFALVKQGTTWTLYIDGVSIGSVDDGGSFGDNSSVFVLGNWTGLTEVFPGFIDEFRFSNVARYTENFTPPTAPFVLD